MDLEDIREYSPGDDVRDIHWQASARSDKTFVKKFKEEKDLNIFFLIDNSASLDDKKKVETIAYLFATLAFAALKGGDSVGALFFNEDIFKIYRPQKSKTQIIRILREILENRPSGKTDIAKSLNSFHKLKFKRGVVVLISDFISNNFKKESNLILKNNELLEIEIFKKSDHNFPEGYLLSLCNSESGEKSIASSSINKTADKNPHRLRLDVEEEIFSNLKLFFKGRRR